MIRDFIFWAAGLTAMRIMVNLESSGGAIFASFLVYVIAKCLADSISPHKSKGVTNKS
jgi:apolipoprotein N-acyltransferase